MSLFTLFIILACVLIKMTSSYVIRKADSRFFDLGQDKTDEDVPKYLKKALVKASKIARLNQYLPTNGEEELKQAIANLYSERINYTLDFDKNVIVTGGASGALFASFQALTSPGDEWIVMDPLWPNYIQMLELVRAVPRYLTLTIMNDTKHIGSGDWGFNRRDLKRMFNSKTKGILLNNPHNPTGKVFSRADLEFIARLTKKHNTYVIADEVFEWTVFAQTPFVNFASLPGMFDHTISIGSASKSLMVSGWRIGWAYAPEQLIKKISFAHNTMFISAPSVPQTAVALALRLERTHLNTKKSFFYKNTKKLKDKRDLLLKALTDVGITPYSTDSGDCLIAKLPKLQAFSFDFVRNISAAEWFTSITRVIGDPMTTFYGKEHAELGKDTMRFCYQKKLQTLQSAQRSLRNLISYV